MSIVMIFLLIIVIFVFLVVHAFFFSSLINIVNFNLDLVCVVFYAMELNTRVLVVMMPSPIVFISPNMWCFGNKKCFLMSYLSKYHMYSNSSLIPLLSFFLLIVMLMLQLHLLLMLLMSMLVMSEPTLLLIVLDALLEYVNPLLILKISSLLCSCFFAWTSFLLQDLYLPFLARCYGSRTLSLN